MPNLLEALSAGARRWFCIQMGTAANFGGLMLGGAGSGTAGLAVEAARRAYAMACDRSAPLPEGPPFLGGQCVGTNYGITFNCNVRYYDQVLGVERVFEPVAFTGNAVGPISFIGFRRVGSNGLEVAYIGSTGESVDNVIPDDPRFVDQQYSVNSITLSPDDELLCGNPSPTYPPYIPGGNTAPSVPIVWEDNDNNTYNDNTDISFGFPVTLPDGTINIPIAFNFNLNPEFNVEGTLHLPDMNLNLNLGGNPGLGGSECNPSSDDYAVDDGNDNYPNPPGDVLPPSDTPGSPERRRILRGCLVNTATVGPAVGQIYQDFNPDIRIPNLGYVNFLVRVGEWQGWSEDIPVKNVNQIIMCPWEGGALMVRGTPRQGVAWSIRNVYTRQTFDPRFPPEPG